MYIYDMTPRRFNASQKGALYLAADGHCSQCGGELELGWHADHMNPYSRGGATDVSNGQALCPGCNLKKGASVSGLRKWQERALLEFRSWLLTQQDPNLGFLVEATPGAGKTRFSIEVARQLMQAGRVERIVIAVPTRRLETQWAEVFATVGININPYWQAANGSLPADEHGCAVTYGEIGYAAQSYRHLTAQRPTLVILDEVHHCADEKTWGNAVRMAFGPASVKLLLSGTPFRSDNNAIPFVRYVDNVGAPDFRYGYDEALGERVVRAVFFPRRGGIMEWDDLDSGRRSHTFDDELTKRDAQYRLRTALDVNSDWLPGVLRDADRQLQEMRETDATAAGIVFCDDEYQARGVNRMLDAMGRSPVLAISADGDSDERIASFKDSRSPWIVSIRKVSEGVDIPRLRVGVYATAQTTELFFRQVVGRVIRTRPDEDDPTGYLFIPDDERLRAHAAQIMEQRDATLKQQEDDLLGGESEETGGPRLLGFMPIAATATDQGMIVNTATVSPAELAEAERVKQLSADTAIMPTPLVAVLLRNAGHAADSSVESPQPQPQPLHERKRHLKQANNTIAKRIAGSYAFEHREVNYVLNVAVGVKSINQASEEQLEKRLGVGRNWLETGNTPQVER